MVSGPLVQELKGFFGTTLPPGTRLVIEIDEPLPQVMAHAHQILQVHINLVVNAAPACLERSDVLVSVQLCPANCQLAVGTGGLDVLQCSLAAPRAGVLLEERDTAAA